MKRLVLILSLLLIPALSLAACGGRAAPEAPAPAEAPASVAAEGAASAEAPAAGPGAEPAPETVTESAPADPAYRAAVDALLEEYRGILPFDAEAFDEAAHPEIPWYSAVLLRFEEQRLYRAFYDFDGNGVDELVMAVGSENYQYPIGVYAFNGEKMVYLCKEQPLGERASLGYADGIFTVTGSGGAGSGVVIDYRIGADGFGTEILRWYEYEYQPDGSVQIRSIAGDMDSEHFDESHLWREFSLPLDYEAIA